LSAAAVAAFLLIASARCGRAGPSLSAADSVLRIGVAQIDVGQLVENLSIEGLVALTDDGRARPWLAKDLTVSEDGLSIDVALRPNVRFHDGSPISAQMVADTLRAGLPRFAGPAFSDVESIEATADNHVELKLRRPSQFIPESLEVEIHKPSAPNIGTGSFMSKGSGSPNTLIANPDYYLQAPSIRRIEIKTYPTVRAAWADMLRGGIDMVHEVGLDELDSLQTAKTINVFSFTRRYQYVMIFNAKAEALKAPEIRRALNAAIDRPALVRDAMGGHGVPSTGPVWLNHWAAAGLPTFAFDPSGAARTIAARRTGKQPALRFTCLVAPDAERESLVVKQQLQAVGVDMNLQEVSHDDFLKMVAAGQFDAVMSSIISGPTVFRAYLWWHSGGPLNRVGYADPKVDAALDKVQHSVSDDEYRAGVRDFQTSILENPPAIFLAWDERARAVSNRFQVVAEPGKDIIRTLHLWRPVAGAAQADKN
jgi:peptide/nickel transport system substrate-binding protein